MEDLCHMVRCHHLDKLCERHSYAHLYDQLVCKPLDMSSHELIKIDLIDLILGS